MNTKTFIPASILVISGACLSGQDIRMQVASGQAFVDDPVDIPIMVDDSTGIVGVTILVTYNTEALDVSVTSDFFPPLVEQLEEAGAFANGEASLGMDVVAHGSAVETNLVPGTGMAISAARVLPSDGSEDILFVLSVSRKDGQTAGTFDISIEPLTVANVNAGYPPGGEQIPLVLGLENTSYRILLDPDNVPANIDPGVAEFLALLADTDNDMMPDPWELQYFETLDQAVTGGDFDNDGLEDIVEYFLGLDPRQKNDPGSLYLLQDGGSCGLFFPMRDLHGLDYLVEWSFDAVEWIPDNVFIYQRPDLASGPEWTLVEASFSTGQNDHGTVLARLVIHPD